MSVRSTAVPAPANARNAEDQIARTKPRPCGVAAFQEPILTAYWVLSLGEHSFVYPSRALREDLRAYWSIAMLAGSRFPSYPPMPPLYLNKRTLSDDVSSNVEHTNVVPFDVKAAENLNAAGLSSKPEVFCTNGSIALPATSTKTRAPALIAASISA
jgi:hypothetical protein